MNETERIDFLVKVLEGNNAKAFATKTAIPEASLSRARKGKARPGAYFERILTAYPQVNKIWLFSGDGEPLKENKEKGEILQRIDGLEKEVKRLASMVEMLVRRN